MMFVGCCTLKGLSKPELNQTSLITLGILTRLEFGGHKFCYSIPIVESSFFFSRMSSAALRTNLPLFQ
jgi:hypothetical protein